jgi:hypothetical protein
MDFRSTKKALPSLWNGKRLILSLFTGTAEAVPFQNPASVASIPRERLPCFRSFFQRPVFMPSARAAFLVVLGMIIPQR